MNCTAEILRIDRARCAFYQNLDATIVPMVIIRKWANSATVTVLSGPPPSRHVRRSCDPVSKDAHFHALDLPDAVGYSPLRLEFPFQPLQPSDLGLSSPSFSHPCRQDGSLTLYAFDTPPLQFPRLASKSAKSSGSPSPNHPSSPSCLPW